MVFAEPGGARIISRLHLPRAKSFELAADQAVVQRRHCAVRGQGFGAKGNERLTALPAPLFALEFEEPSGIIAHDYVPFMSVSDRADSGDLSGRFDQGKSALPNDRQLLLQRLYLSRDFVVRSSSEQVLTLTSAAFKRGCTYGAAFSAAGAPHNPPSRPEQHDRMHHLERRELRPEPLGTPRRTSVA